jgi:hypothetical protein
MDVALVVVDNNCREEKGAPLREELDDAGADDSATTNTITMPAANLLQLLRRRGGTIIEKKEFINKTRGNLCKLDNQFLPSPSANSSAIGKE